MKKILIFFATLCFLISRAQDPIFLNTNASLIHLNPSFAGSNGGVRDQASFRNQWPSLSGGYVTYLNSFDAYIKPLHGGIAFSCMSDYFGKGTLVTKAFNLSYAQYLNFHDGNLKVIPSVQVGYGQKILDKNNLHYGDVIDPRTGVIWNDPTVAPSPGRTFINTGAGVLVQYKKNLFFGASASNINQPDVGLLGSQALPFRLTLHVSYTFDLSTWTKLQIACRYQDQQKLRMNQIGFNSISAEHYIVGVGLASDINPMINLGYKGDYFTITAGYDMFFSELSKSNMGSGEIHASFNLRNKENRKALTSFETW